MNLRNVSTTSLRQKVNVDLLSNFVSLPFRSVLVNTAVSRTNVFHLTYHLKRENTQKGLTIKIFRPNFVGDSYTCFIISPLKGAPRNKRHFTRKKTVQFTGVYVNPVQNGSLSTFDNTN